MKRIALNEVVRGDIILWEFGDSEKGAVICGVFEKAEIVDEHWREKVKRRTEIYFSKKFFVAKEDLIGPGNNFLYLGKYDKLFLVCEDELERLQLLYSA